MNVVVLGASDNPERYSHRALILLKAKGHQVIPVNPRLQVLEGIPVAPSIRDVTGPVDTLTLYVGKSRSEPLIRDILALKPRRLIFNPGSENEALQNAAQAAGIEVVHGCTLVMLSTGQF